MDMTALQIDPEFRSQIPPLTADELAQLRENILADGEVYEPIAVWNNTIIDGHNRWEIIKENWDVLKDRFRIREMEFPDKAAAFDWMYRKQLGRRNLTESQRSFMVGKMYEVRKQAQGGDHGNQYTKAAGGQNVHSAKADKTAEAIGAEFGMTGRSVQRAEKFAHGVDTLRGVSVEAANRVLSGQSGVTKETICRLPEMEPEAVTEIADAIVNGAPIPHQESGTRKRRAMTEEERAERAKLEAIAADMYDPSTIPEYTVDTMLDDIQLCASEFLVQIRSLLRERSTILTDENRPKIADAITHYIIDEIGKIRDLL